MLLETGSLATELDSTDGLTAITQRIEAASIVPQPFPHIVLEDFLPTSAFQVLARSIPPLDHFKKSKTGLKFDLDITDSKSEFAGSPEVTQSNWRYARDVLL